MNLGGQSPGSAHGPCRPLPALPQELASGATLAAVKSLLNSILPSWLAEFARLLGRPLSADVSAAGRCRGCAGAGTARIGIASRACASATLALVCRFGVVSGAGCTEKNPSRADRRMPRRGACIWSVRAACCCWSPASPTWRRRTSAPHCRPHGRWAVRPALWSCTASARSRTQRWLEAASVHRGGGGRGAAGPPACLPPADSCLRWGPAPADVRHLAAPVLRARHLQR